MTEGQADEFLNRKLEEVQARKIKAENQEHDQLCSRFKLHVRRKDAVDNSSGIQSDPAAERDNSTQDAELRTNLLEKLEKKVRSAERRIDVNDYFDFLQSIPMPGSCHFCFVTLQGQPKLSTDSPSKG